MRLADLITPFQPADGAPPRRLGAFFLWCLGGSWKALLIASVVSALAGVTEIVSATILGAVIDATASTDPQGFFGAHAWLIAVFLGFYLLARPLIFAASSAANSVVIGPNVMPLVLSRLHRWTMGQAVTVL